jgi:dinuclear metal center YbgI/SA1388 family protein
VASVRTISELLEANFPRRLAEEWDNVGLLVGDPSRSVRRVMTCLTITPSSAGEAVSRGADLIVTHHPLPFRPLSRITTETPEGHLLLSLIGAGVAVYSPHTAYDSGAAGVNQQLAEGLKLSQIEPLVPGEEGLGGGRCGLVDRTCTLGEFAQRVKVLLGVAHLQWVGSMEQRIAKVGVACGSGGDFLLAADAADCDCLVTGEARFHTCLAAESLDLGLILPGHFASERFALEWLAEWLAGQIPDVEVWASQNERDPLRFL